MRFLLLLLVLSILALGLFSSVVLAGGIGWEAEDTVAITPPMAVFEDPKLSNGKYVYSPTANQGSVEYEFEVPKDGTYYM